MICPTNIKRKTFEYFKHVLSGFNIALHRQQLMNYVGNAAF